MLFKTFYSIFDQEFNNIQILIDLSHNRLRFLLIKSPALEKNIFKIQLKFLEDQKAKIRSKDFGLLVWSLLIWLAFGLEARLNLWSWSWSGLLVATRPKTKDQETNFSIPNLISC